jgi:hypothetical protein
MNYESKELAPKVHWTVGPFIFPFSVIIGLADPLAAGQVTEAQHGHSATGGNEMQKNSIKKLKI